MLAEDIPPTAEPVCNYIADVERWRHLLQDNREWRAFTVRVQLHLPER
jgi:hypothetical protein